MGYLDYAGLQYLWGKLKEKFALKSHSHDDRYYTEAEVNGKLNSKVDNNEAGANGLLSKLTTSWTAIPTDNTYFIRQDTGGGNEFGRVKFSTLWNYIKGKTDGVYQPKGSYSTTDTKNTAGSTNTTSKLYLIGATSQSTNPQTYSNAGVYTTGSTIYANGFGNDIFIIYPSGGSASYGGQQIGYCKITLPTLWDSTMMTFTVTIYNYVSNTSVDYRISGYNYYGKPWYNCAAVCIGKAGTSHSNLSVRFGDNGTKNVITIGEENTEWEYPRIVVHDVVIGNSDFETYKSGWNVEISKSGAPNVSETISNTHVGYNAVTSWDKIQNKPSSFTPASHAHDDRYYTETEMNAKLDGKANSNHSHYSITTVADNRNTNTTPNDYRNTLIFQGLKDNSKINSPSSDTYSYLLGLRGWSDSSGGNSHELAFNNTGVYWRNGGTTSWNGWNRIYTDNYHPMADVANSVDWSKVQNKPATYTPATHTHDDRYYTEAEINNKLDGKSNTGHTHDDRYYTESEMNAKLAEKSNINHTHNSIKDAGDGGTLTLAYSKSGLDYGSYSWLAGWNGKELRAVNKNQFATAYHTHDTSSISAGNANYACGAGPIESAHIDVLRANRLAFLPASGVKVEYSVDNGATWIDYGATDDQKASLFAMRMGSAASFYTGKHTKAAECTTKDQLRITVTPVDRYASVNMLYLWVSVAGTSATVNISRSTIGAKETFTDVRTDVPISGWSGPNEIRFSGGTFGGYEGQNYNAYAYRFTFKNKADGKGSVSVMDIRMYGPSAWGVPNSMMEKDHIYNWDANQNVQFPAQVTATKFNGSSTGVVDYGDSNGSTIKVGFNGAGLTKDNLKHIAGYAKDGNQTIIKDVSRGVLQSWLNLNEMINTQLTTGSSTPSDNDFYISQYAGGGATTTTYHRRPVSALWSYIKSKADAVYSAKSHTHTKSQITDFPASLKNPTALTIQTNGTTAAIYDGSAAKTVNITKGNIGLGNVDNTADVDKSVKYATSAGSASTATKATTAGTADKANSVDWSKVQNKPSSYTPASHTHNYAGSTSAGGAAISANALNPTVTLTGGDGDVTGYRLIGQVSIGQWGNYRCVMLVNSRHQGAGLVTVTIGNNTNSITQNNAYAEIKYWGPTSSGSVISSSSYQVYISSDGKIGYLFWQYYDYSPCVVRVLGSDFTISNGTWMTGIGSGYGKCVATTQINAASTANNATYSTYVKDISNSSDTTFAYSKPGMNYGDYTWLAAWNGHELRSVDKNQFATAGHTHNSVSDIGSGETTTFAYSKSGMNYGDYTWLAGWNGYELRAVNKNQFATAEQGVVASGSNYVRFGDGTQICWYTNLSSGSILFYVPFIDTNYAIVCFDSNLGGILYPVYTDKQTTGVKLDNVKDVVCIGRWK